MKKEIIYKLIITLNVFQNYYQPNVRLQNNDISHLLIMGNSTIFIIIQLIYIA